MKSLKTTKTPFFGFLAVCLVLVSSNTYAKRKKKINFKDKTVIITDDKGVRHTAFPLKLKDKVVLVCHENAFTINSTISDFKDNEIAYSGIIIPSPDLQCKILFIQLPEDSQDLPAFEIEDKPAEKLKKGTSLTIYGCRKDKKKLGGGKGTVKTVDKNKISIDSGIIYDITGAPVIATDTGKVVGVAVCKKKKRYQISYAIRIDNIAKTETVNKKAVEYEISRCETLYEALLKYSEAYTEITELIKKAKISPITNNKSLRRKLTGKSFARIINIIRESGINKPETLFEHISSENALKLIKKFKQLKKKLTDAKKELSKAMNTLRKTPKLKIPMIKKLYNQNFSRGDEIVERKFAPKEKELEQILEILEKRANAVE